MFSQLFARPWKMSARDAVLTLKGALHAPWFDETLAAITRPGETFRGGEQLDVPVTIAWGERDWLLPRKRQAPRAARAIPGARSITLQGCGHVPTFDDPEQVARVLLEGSSAQRGRAPA
jgi:pimeloyl-ACP methyl ester carboxylesterase